ncbi:unnamed protein product [Caenorhabditis nigoni]
MGFPFLSLPYELQYAVVRECDDDDFQLKFGLVSNRATQTLCFAHRCKIIQKSSVIVTQANGEQINIQEVRKNTNNRDVQFKNKVVVSPAVQISPGAVTIDYAVEDVLNNIDKTFVEIAVRKNDLQANVVDMSVLKKFREAVIPQQIMSFGGITRNGEKSLFLVEPGLQVYQENYF